MHLSHANGAPTGAKNAPLAVKNAKLNYVPINPHTTAAEIATCIALSMNVRMVHMTCAEHVIVILQWSHAAGKYYIIKRKMQITKMIKGKKS